MLVVGTPAQVDRYAAQLDGGLAASEALKGLRGPTEGQLTYTADGQTVTQQPFGFESYSARIERPGWTCLTPPERGRGAVRIRLHARNRRAGRHGHAG